MFTDAEFLAACEFVFKETGIVLDSTKGYLIEGRLKPLEQGANVSTLGDLIKKAHTDRAIKQKIIDAVSTNETYFFRDVKPFDLIKNHLAPTTLEKGNSLSIWSAASSTGQEAYSIAMALKEILFDLTKYRIKITGSDISTEAVHKANHGVYTRFELSRGLSPVQISRYFTPFGTTGDYKIDDELRSVVQFGQANLLTTPLMLGLYDIVLCRNVAIYFNKSDKRLLFERVHRTLKPRGALLVGSTESMLEYGDLFERGQYHNTVYYIKK